jgi:3'-5' exoribonuclease
VIEGVWEEKEFRGEPQLDLKELKDIISKDSIEDFSPYVRQGAVSKDLWMGFFNSNIRPLIEDEPIEAIIDVVLNGKHFWKAPAAKKMHQNWIGGLAEHTYRILRLFYGLLNSGHPTFQGVRKGLVIAGIVLHDWCKFKEYDEVAPGQYEYSRFGGLMGHLAGGPVFIQRVCSSRGIEMSDELWMHFNHVLLAHHGTIEWGSPVVPATLEALIVHMLDNMDGKLSMLEEAEENDYVRGLSTRRITYHEDIDAD